MVSSPLYRHYLTTVVDKNDIRKSRRVGASVSRPVESPSSLSLVVFFCVCVGFFSRHSLAVFPRERMSRRRDLKSPRRRSWPDDVNNSS